MLEEQLKKVKIPPKGIEYITDVLSFLYQISPNVVENAVKMIISGKNPVDYIEKRIISANNLDKSYANYLAKRIIEDIYRMLKHKSWIDSYWNRLLFSGNLYKPLQNIEIVW